MNSRQEIEELIERYSTGNLGPDEARIFEKWLQNDESMAQAVADHKTILAAFDNYADRLALREKLSRIHSEMETEQFRYRSPLRKIEEEPQKVVSKLRFLWNNHRVASIAAAIIITAISAALIGYGLSGLTNKKQQSAYQELRREVESIKRRQRALINNSVTDKKENEANSPVFTGTGFALTRDGYVLTSYHVIQDAKSIVLTNNRFEQLTAETVYSDQVLDLALLKINSSDFIGFSDIPYNFRRSVADPGERVFTLGFPREELVFGEGSISSYTGYEGDTCSYQISIPVNPGNSGGPLFDVQGNLLGIISGRNSGAEAASFAVKSRWIAEYIQDHQSTEKIVFPSRHLLNGMDRSAQIKRLSDFVFMVRVTN